LTASGYDGFGVVALMWINAAMVPGLIMSRQVPRWPSRGPLRGDIIVKNRAKIACERARLFPAN